MEITRAKRVREEEETKKAVKEKLAAHKKTSEELQGIRNTFENRTEEEKQFWSKQEKNAKKQANATIYQVIATGAMAFFTLILATSAVNTGISSQALLSDQNKLVLGLMTDQNQLMQKQNDLQEQLVVLYEKGLLKSEAVKLRLPYYGEGELIYLPTETNIGINFIVRNVGDLDIEFISGVPYARLICPGYSPAKDGLRTPRPTGPEKIMSGEPKEYSFEFPIDFVKDYQEAEGCKISFCFMSADKAVELQCLNRNVSWMTSDLNE